MTRIVAKTAQTELAVTSAQPGVLYVSSLPVEKNIFLGVRRKLKTMVQAFDAVRGRRGQVQICNASSCSVHLPSQSVDYTFTDPPFGGNIPYAEINFVNEAWLGKYTDRSDEAIVSNVQNKGINEYKRLLTRAFSEVSRIAKPNSKTTVVFHSASADVWNALQGAYEVAGFTVRHAGVLDKLQGSFKQVTTGGAVKGDPLLLLEKGSGNLTPRTVDVWELASALCHEALSSQDPNERQPRRLYSRLVGHYLANQLEVPIDAKSFYDWYSNQSKAAE
jgi:hypothetical protein